MRLALDLSLTSRASLQGASSPPTVLFREANGTVSVMSLATPWKPTLTRQGDGTVTVTG